MILRRLLMSGGDPYAASVVSLLHADGADGSTVFTDAKGRSWTRTGNARILTAQSMFGGASAYFGGAGDSITAAATPDFDLFASPFTIEFFYYTTDVSGNRALCEFGTSLSNRLNISIVSGSLLAYNQSAGGSGTVVSAVVAVAGAWRHVALTKDATGLWRLGHHGTIVSTSTSPYYPAGSLGASIGRAAYGGGSDYIGHIDEFRVTKGVARYAADYTVPSSPFTTG